MIDQLFSERDRSDLLSQLKHFAANHDKIMGMVLVGSGARGFNDRYSDLDILFIVGPSDIPAVLASVESWFATTYQPIFFTSYQHRDDVFVLCYLMEKFLEVDVGIWSTTSLFASRPDWQILQARSERDRMTIEMCLREHPALPRPYAPIISGDDSLWQIVNGYCIARLRKDTAKEHDYIQQLSDRGLSSSNGEREQEGTLIKEALESTYDSQRVQKLERFLALCYERPT